MRSETTWIRLVGDVLLRNATCVLRSQLGPDTSAWIRLRADAKPTQEEGDTGPVGKCFSTRGLSLRRRALPEFPAPTEQYLYNYYYNIMFTSPTGGIRLIAADISPILTLNVVVVGTTDRLLGESPPGWVSRSFTLASRGAGPVRGVSR